MRNHSLYGWVFTFNPFDQLWTATERENLGALFSGTLAKQKTLRSTNINTLIELINKTEGQPKKIDSLLKNQVKHLIVEKC